MKINAGKTKVMRFTKREDKEVKINIGPQEIENVKQFRYLGALINNNGRDHKEIKSRIGMAKTAFNNLANVLGNRTMSIDLRKRIMRCYVWTVLKYSCETWTMSAECEKKVSAFEMWCYRRLLRISWKDFVTNKEVLARIGEERKVVVEDIKNRKLKYLAHKIRENGIFMLAVQGKIQGRSTRGRKRSELLTTNSPANSPCKTLKETIRYARYRLI